MAAPPTHAAADLASHALLLRALADENRLRLLALLAGGEQCVCNIAGALGLTQPNASQHLGVLKMAGVVSVERRGNWAWYRLREVQDPAQAAILRAVLSGIAPPPLSAPRACE